MSALRRTVLQVALLCLMSAGSAMAGGSSGPDGMLPTGSNAASAALGNIAKAEGALVVPSGATPPSALATQTGGLAFLVGTFSGTTPVRLTADGLTAGATNVLNLPPSSELGDEFNLQCFSTSGTTAGDFAQWLLKGFSARRIGSGNVGLSAGSITNGAPNNNGGTGSTMVINFSADTVNQGLNLSVTPNPSNADTWRCKAVFIVNLP
jgi:hypothetical protein